ncbi:hypothetical protein Ga0466249_001742 [Sporomusaceae bacterium BoRhaA]|uniref:DUF3343 domain-containing protein n=1 Tax=Pelorhabdus rhamnosifermentans TaxID=2772457 RepID=UPI001C05F602|nr:DUF3343 domain-containing protein [Pelorhabdus rhamnosifermentans]MBU2700650.1 hypothetical protein [Pelorhabdus rhamnosifermentans]
MKLFSNYNRLVSFVSVHQAVLAEEALNQAGISVLLIPTPRDLAISCGMCLLFSQLMEDTVFEIFSKQHILWSKYYSCQAERRLYEKLGDYKGG